MLNALTAMRVVQRRMAAHLRPLPVRSGVVRAVRNWKQWLGPLDGIKVKEGVVGLKSAHWFCFTRRQDLPLDVAGALAEGGAGDGAASAPGDVMLMSKEFMSSANLAQAPLLFCRAGMSNVLPSPTGPPAWEPNSDFTHDYKVDAARLAEKVRKLLPARAGAIEHMQEWMARPRVPPAPPDPPLILQHRCGPIGDQIGLVLERAVSQCAPAQPRLMQIRRRRVEGEASVVADLPLPAWVTFREAQGVSVDEAVREWNGARVLRRA